MRRERKLCRKKRRKRESPAILSIKRDENVFANDDKRVVKWKKIAWKIKMCFQRWQRMAFSSFSAHTNKKGSSFQYFSSHHHYPSLSHSLSYPIFPRVYIVVQHLMARATPWRGKIDIWLRYVQHIYFSFFLSFFFENGIYERSSNASERVLLCLHFPRNSMYVFWIVFTSHSYFTLVPTTFFSLSLSPFAAVCTMPHIHTHTLAMHSYVFALKQVTQTIPAYKPARRILSNLSQRDEKTFSYRFFSLITCLKIIATNKIPKWL